MGAVSSEEQPRGHTKPSLLVLYSGDFGAYSYSNLDLYCMNVMFAGMLGGWEIILILAVVLILFGAKKLPELAKGLGTGIKEFKKATREVQDEIHSAMDETPPPPKRIASTTSSPAENPVQPETGTAVSQSAPNPKA